jgi:hypothetical protein
VNPAERIISPGDRVELPSRNVVQVISHSERGDDYWICGYILNGRLVGPGKFEANRVTLRGVFLRQYLKT